MRALSTSADIRIDGFLCPAHVSAIIGSKAYDFLADEYSKACVVTGFEPLDVLQGIIMILKQIQDKNFYVDIQYSRVVKREGNKKAVELIFDIFMESESNWRGIGTIDKTGLILNEKYSQFNAEKKFDIKIPESKEPKGCICGLILQGIKEPTDCKLFKKTCTPENPVGACMVSGEGTCAAYYKYS